MAGGSLFMDRTLRLSIEAEIIQTMTEGAMAKSISLIWLTLDTGDFAFLRVFASGSLLVRGSESGMSGRMGN